MNSIVVAFVVVAPIVVSVLETCVSLLVEVVLESVDLTVVLLFTGTVEVDSEPEASSLVLDVVVVLESDVVCSTESQVTGE